MAQSVGNGAANLDVSTSVFEPECYWQLIGNYRIISKRVSQEHPPTTPLIPGIGLQCCVRFQLHPLFSLSPDSGLCPLAQSWTFRRNLYKMEYSMLCWRFSSHQSFFSSSQRAWHFPFFECFCLWPFCRAYEGEENSLSLTAWNAGLLLLVLPSLCCLGNASWVFLSPVAWLWGQLFKSAVSLSLL